MLNDNCLLINVPTLKRKNSPIITNYTKKCIDKNLKTTHIIKYLVFIGTCLILEEDFRFFLLAPFGLCINEL